MKIFILVSNFFKMYDFFSSTSLFFHTCLHTFPRYLKVDNAPRELLADLGGLILKLSLCSCQRVVFAIEYFVFVAMLQYLKFYFITLKMQLFCGQYSSIKPGVDSFRRTNTGHYLVNSSTKPETQDEKTFRVIQSFLSN